MACVAWGPGGMFAAQALLPFLLLCFRSALLWTYFRSFCSTFMPPCFFLWIHLPVCMLLFWPASLRSQYDCSWLPALMCTYITKRQWFLCFCKSNHIHRPILSLLWVWNKIKCYIPSMLIRVMVSSMRPTLRISSSLVLALMLGPPLTSRSQALPFESNMKSNPYN